MKFTLHALPLVALLGCVNGLSQQFASDKPTPSARSPYVGLRPGEELLDFLDRSDAAETNYYLTSSIGSQHTASDGSGDRSVYTILSRTYDQTTGITLVIVGYRSAHSFNHKTTNELMCMVETGRIEMSYNAKGKSESHIPQNDSITTTSGDCP